MTVYNGESQLILVATQMGCYRVVLNLSAFVLVLIFADMRGRVFFHQSRIYKVKAYIAHALVSNPYLSIFLFSSDIDPGMCRPHNYNNQLL